MQDAIVIDIDTTGTWIGDFQAIEEASAKIRQQYPTLQPYDADPGFWLTLRDTDRVVDIQVN